jgi:hypothetical protein
MGITAINGIAITASTSTSASVANTISVLNTPTGTGPYYLTFVDATSGYETLLVDNSTLTYNATSNTLTATTFAGTASAATLLNVIVNTSNNNQNYILFTPQFNGGGSAPVQVSESGNIVFNPSTTEFRAGLINNQSAGTKAFTGDANLTVDASLTQSVTWIASLTATRSLIINNLLDGRNVIVYIRNTNATQRQIVFSGSTSTTGHVGMNMSVGAGVASAITQSIVGTSGTMLVHAFNIAGNLVGGLS